MTYDEWFYEGCRSYRSDEAYESSKEAWDYQQQKIDKALAELDRLKCTTGLNCISKVQEILK